MGRKTKEERTRGLAFLTHQDRVRLQKMMMLEARGMKFEDFRCFGDQALAGAGGESLGD